MTELAHKKTLFNKPITLHQSSAIEVDGTRTGVTIAAALAFRAVRHDYDGFVSIQGMDLDIAPGEITCLLGESGCGKTTLLRLAAGIEQPSVGMVTLDGLELSGPNRFVAPEKRGIGLMFQDNALFPHLTVLQNVMYGLSSLRRHEAEAEAARFLDRVGLGDQKRDYPHMLSGGQQQRVTLARALAPRPRVLLMDEPFSGLDRRLRQDLRADVNTVLRTSRATAVLVTHDPEEALSMGDRIALMRAGRLVQHATPKELYRYPNSLYAARFLSHLMEIEGRVQDKMIRTPLGPVAAEGLTNGDRVVVGIRPRGLIIAPTSARGGVEARVLASRFLGEVDELTVAVDGIAHPILVKVRDADAALAARSVCLTLDPLQVVVVPEASPVEMDSFDRICERESVAW